MPPRLRLSSFAIATIIAGQFAFGGPSLAQADVEGLVGAVAASCSQVDLAQHEGSGGPHYHACRDAQKALFAAAPMVSQAEQEHLGLAFVEVAKFEPPVNPAIEYPTRVVMPFMNSELRGAVVTACTEGFKGSTPVLEECLAVTRVAMVGAQVSFKGEMGDLATDLCQIPRFAPAEFHGPFLALVDEIVARSASGSDPVIGGDFSKLAERRTKADCQ